MPINSIGAFYHALLQQAGDLETPGLELDRLFEKVLGCSVAVLRAFPEKSISPEHGEKIEQLFKRRLAGEPLAYILGEQGFWDIVLKVNEQTLIPRPETELLVEYLLAQWGPETQKKVVDLGTGSGAIALALAKARPRWEIWGVDQSAGALAIARENAAALKAQNVHWRQSDWFSGLEGMAFDAIISNPPYIAAHEPHPGIGDCRFEPLSALVSGETGLEDLQLLIEQARAYLNSEGLLVLEHGFRQQAQVLALMRDMGWVNPTGFVDLTGWPRMVVGKKLGA